MRIYIYVCLCLCIYTDILHSEFVSVDINLSTTDFIFFRKILNQDSNGVKKQTAKQYLTQITVMGTRWWVEPFLRP